MTPEAFITRLSHVEKALAAAAGAGKVFPPMSEWWAATFARFYRSARRQLVLRVGRRGGKSSSLCRVAVVEALFGAHQITAGDLGVVAIVSVSRDEAAQRLRTVKAILDAMGVRYRPIDGGIELESRPVAFKVFAASVSGVSGFTCICAICDEVAKWKDADTGSNPATEVLSSLRPTMATMPEARIFLSSSPLGQLDAHAVAFELGDTAHQVVAFAPTWVAHPALTEEQTRADEPNERVWKREYGAIPQGELTAIFDLVDIDAAMTSRPADVELDGQFKRFMCLDWSRGRDARAFLIARYVAEVTPMTAETAPLAPSKVPWCWPVAPRIKSVWNEAEGRFDRVVHRQDRRGDWHLFEDRTGASAPRLVMDVEEIGEVPNGLNTESAVAHIVGRAKQWRPRGWETERVKTVICDQYEAGALSVLLSQAKLEPHEQTWTQASKRAGVDRLERLLRDRSIRFPANPKLRRQLAEYSERVTRAGSIAYSGSGKHDDYAAVVVTLAQALVFTRLIDGNPDREMNHRTEIPYA